MGELTKREVEEAVPDGTFSRILRQLKWDKIVDIVEHLPRNLQDLIQRAAVGKRRGKLRRRRIRQKKHRKGDSIVELNDENLNVVGESE